MARHAAFLRGVNLGRNRKAGSAELRACFEEAGFDEVQTFRTSGNVVFDAARAPSAATIEKALAKALGFDVTVFLRSAKQIEAIVSKEPFAPKLVERSKGKLQVSFLPRKPSASARRQVEALATDADRLAFGPAELYWLPEGGTMESELDRKTIEDLVGPSTMRTMGTVEQLASKYFGLAR
jgi:uncharacterized protein (DUF1697 family)